MSAEQLVSFDDETGLTAYWLGWVEAYEIRQGPGVVARVETLEDVEDVMSHYAERTEHE